MRYYEILYIINPNFEKDKINSTIVEVTRKLEETKSKIINHYIWGKKRLSYPINNQKYGTYVLLQFEDGDRIKMNDFDTWMKLENLIMRHITIKLDNRPEVIEESNENDKKIEIDNPSIESSQKEVNMDDAQIAEKQESMESKNKDDK
ncbi:MAG: 30S ribosomal protein S6 [Candidatus Marinimicrobia bacterium]|nr:30S ribosomal protein S6 [Candidatus Neomarinimicrobiota bacterium]